MSIARRASSTAFVLVALAGAPQLLAAGGWYLLIRLAAVTTY
jgi:hypothetical protein